MYNTLRELIKYQSVSGRERRLANAVEKAVAPYADNVSKDAMGNIIAFKKGSSDSASKLMIAAHMDEIGFITTYIDENGFVRFSQIGGINYTSAAFSNVVFENGTQGVLVPEDGCKPGDIASDSCYVDIGAKNREDAESKVKIGDTFAVVPGVKKLSSDRIAGRPLDDKIGCAVLIEALKKCENAANDTYFVFTVQEEVGLRGSKTAAFGIMPDYGIAVDVCGACDVPGAKPGVKISDVKLGGGAAVKIKDASVMCDGEFVELICKTADEKKIPWQAEILTKGGTDAASMQMTGQGCRAAGISIPTRYVHTTVETVDMKDAEAASELIASVAALKL